MKGYVVAMTGCLFLASTGIAAAEPGQGRGKRHDAVEASARNAGTGVQVSVVFSTGDIHLIRQYYATPRYGTLPKGLQKKVARGGQLPPGWQKKMQPLPMTLERQLVVLPSGYHRGVIDGHAVIYSPQRGVVIDATVIL
jgi:hypothetical protein